jgi:dienelactone hydrolase
MSSESLPVEIESQGSVVRGALFPAQGLRPRPTALVIPEWPCVPDDDFGLAARLAERGASTLVMCPRGFAPSEGTMTFEHVLEDIAAVAGWLTREAPQEHRTTPDRLVLGGHGFGGGVALAYAAGDPAIRAVFAIAGTDHAELVRKAERDSAYGEVVLGRLRATEAPAGPVDFRVETIWAELHDHPDRFGLRENAGALADRSLLLIGGWRDRNVSIDDFVLPFYRSLEVAGADDVMIQAYPDDHAFSRVRRQLLSDVSDWVGRRALSAASRVRLNTGDA